MSQEQLKALLESCLSAFNEIPNKKLKRGDFPSTYALAAALNTALKASKQGE
ncbi:TPA: cobalamin biosynthesis protein CbiX [Yersinia enterocolitica]